MGYSDAYVVGLESQVDALRTRVKDARAEAERLRELLRDAVDMLRGFDFSTDASEDTTEQICERFKGEIQEAFTAGSLRAAASAVK